MSARTTSPAWTTGVVPSCSQMTAGKTANESSEASGSTRLGRGRTARRIAMAASTGSIMITNATGSTASAKPQPAEFARPPSNPWKTGHIWPTTAAIPQASCTSSGSPRARATTTATKPFAASSSPPTIASPGPTLFQRLLPPSFREPTARRSTPRARATQYGKETEPARYDSRTATAATTVILRAVQMRVSVPSDRPRKTYHSGSRRPLGVRRHRLV